MIKVAKPCDKKIYLSDKYKKNYNTDIWQYTLCTKVFQDYKEKLSYAIDGYTVLIMCMVQSQTISN